MSNRAAEAVSERDAIRRALRRHGAPAQEIEDLEHEVVEALLRRQAAPQRGLLSTWIWAVCRNVAKNHRRRHAIRSATRPEVALAFLGVSHDPADGLHAADARSWIYRALWKLPPMSRQVVFLRELDGAGYDEIARSLRIKETAARVAHHRGMKQLALYAGSGPR